jgi:hypothetical protein
MGSHYSIIVFKRKQVCNHTTFLKRCMIRFKSDPPPLEVLEVFEKSGIEKKFRFELEMISQYDIDLIGR